MRSFSAAHRWSHSSLRRAHCDAVAVDTPSVNLLPDSLSLAAAGDAVLLVGRAGKSHREEAAMANRNDKAVHVPLASAVLHDTNEQRASRNRNFY